MTTPKVSVLDSITRIYKNSAGRVIGIHSISVIENRPLVPDPRPGVVSNARFKRTGSITTSFSRFNLQMGESRFIASIQMIGGYDEFEYNNDTNDIVEVKYFGGEGVNDLTIDLREFPQIGEEV